MQCKLGVMQPYFFPYLGYFQLIDSVDKFVLYNKVSFRKKSWITRNRILDKGNGQPFYINVPVKKQSSNRLIEDIYVDCSQNWQSNLINLIYYNYKKADYFDVIFPQVERLLNIPEDNLHLYNAKIIKSICCLLKIDTQIITDRKSFEEVEQRLYEYNQGDVMVDTKTERVVELCKLMGANTYVNPIGGMELYHKEDFYHNNLNLFFVNSTYGTYSQFGFDHVPHLSILDVLMHNGICQTIKLINKYELF